MAFKVKKCDCTILLDPKYVPQSLQRLPAIIAYLFKKLKINSIQIVRKNNLPACNLVTVLGFETKL